MKSLGQRVVCTPMSIVRLFMIAVIQKQPKCPRVDECIGKIWYIHKMFSLEKEENYVTCDYIEESGEHDSKLNKPGIER